MKFFEDIKIGERAELGAYTFTADEIVEFARKFDPIYEAWIEAGAQDN